MRDSAWPHGVLLEHTPHYIQQQQYIHSLMSHCSAEVKLVVMLPSYTQFVEGWVWVMVGNIGGFDQIMTKGHLRVQFGLQSDTQQPQCVQTG